MLPPPSVPTAHSAHSSPPISPSPSLIKSLSPPSPSPSMRKSLRRPSFIQRLSSSPHFQDSPPSPTTTVRSARFSDVDLDSPLEFGTVTIRVLKGGNLPIAPLQDKDSCNPYVKLRLAGSKYKTKVRKNTVNPEWADEKPFVCSNVHVESVVDVRLMHKPRLGKSGKLLREATLHIRAISDQPYGIDFTVDYSLPIDVNVPDSELLFRVEFEFDAPQTQPQPHGVLRRQSDTTFPSSLPSIQLSLTPPPTEPAAGESEDMPLVPSTTIGTLTVVVEEGTCFPSANFIYLKLKVEKNSMRTKHFQKSPNPKWDETFVFTNVHIANVLDVKVFDKTGISGSNIGQLKLALGSLSFENPGTDFVFDKWHFISTKYPSAQLFLKLSFKYGINNSKKVKATMSKKRLKRQLSRHQRGPGYFGEPRLKQYQLRCHFFQGRDLIAADTTGLSDPYIAVYCVGTISKTSVQKHTLNPAWFETVVMNVHLPQPLHYAPDVQFAVYDSDKFSDDDLLGRFWVTCQEIQTMSKLDGLDPKWFPLTDSDGAASQGEILAFFEFLSVEQSRTPLPNLIPKNKPMYLHLLTLGLRHLQSSVAPHKPQIEFQLPNGTMYSTTQCGTPSPESPNYLQHLIIPVDVPFDRLYAPTVHLEVKDTIFGGLVKRTLGTANISLAEFMEDSKDGREPSTSQSRSYLEPSAPAPAESKYSGYIDDKSSPKIHSNKSDRSFGSYIIEHRDSTDESKSAFPTMTLLDARSDSASSSRRPPSYRGLQIQEEGAETPLLSMNGDAEPGQYQESDHIVDINGYSPEGSRREGPAGYGDDDGNSNGVPVGLEPSGDNGDNGESTGKQDDVTSQTSEQNEQFDIGEDITRGLNGGDEDVPPYMIGRRKLDAEYEKLYPASPWFKTGVYVGQVNANAVLGTHFKRVGTYKGKIHLTENKSDDFAFDIAGLLKPKRLHLRIYVMRGYRLTPQDPDGTSDPYLIIRLGNQKISTRDDHLQNTNDPEFYVGFEIRALIPGDSELRVQVWDHDGIGDDFIGETIYDIEDFWFDNNWRGVKIKPVEIRNLYNPSCSFPQGKLETLMEIYTVTEAKRLPMYDIRPPPPLPFELRVIIWKVRDIISESLTEMNDLYVTGFLDVPGLKKQKTDLHLRSKKGRGNFNWRMKFNVDLPLSRPARFLLQVWNMDLLSANDTICEVNFSVAGLLREAFRRKDRVKLLEMGMEKIWINGLRHPNYEENQGSMQISMEVMPQSIAQQIPAGFGRSDPNMNPNLPDPEGRFQWRLNPFAMMLDACGPEMCAKITCAFVCTMVIAFIVLLGPQLLSFAVLGSMFG